jgi:hypothetical protein
VHHTFCHIKALATVLDHGLRGVAGGGDVLPRGSVYGYRFFRDIQTWLVSVGGFRATVTAYDREYKAMHAGHATGGALTMLWHEKTGPLFCASMNAYQMVEAGNMQADDDPLSMPLTPRIELVEDGVTYLCCGDLGATVEVYGDVPRVKVIARGRLVDKDQRDPAGGVAAFTAEYVFRDKGVEVSFRCADTRARVVLPLISRSGEAVEMGDRRITVRKANMTVVLEADKALVRLPTTGERLFNFVPGFEAVPVEVKDGTVRFSLQIY